MGSVNKIVKRSPGFIKRLYYNSVPFSKRYGKVYENTLSFLMESSKWDIETKKEYQLTQMQNLLSHCLSRTFHFTSKFLLIIIGNQKTLEQLMI